MEVTAQLRHVRMGTRKGRAVAELVRTRPVEQALAILRASPRGAARPLEKLIRSALANAQEKNARQQAGIDLDNLYVKRVVVDQGPHVWRIRPRAQSRMAYIQKQTSHVTVVLDER